LLADAATAIPAERVGPITAKYFRPLYEMRFLFCINRYNLSLLGSFPAFKQRMTIFEVPRDIEATLDIAKVRCNE
jgi:hypothetical protein